MNTAASFCPLSRAEVRSLWAQLSRDEPDLLSNFEDFLARVTSQIREANQEKKEMESALQRSGRLVTGVIQNHGLSSSAWLWAAATLHLHISAVSVQEGSNTR